MFCWHLLAGNSYSYKLYKHCEYKLVCAVKHNKLCYNIYYKDKIWNKIFIREKIKKTNNELYKLHLKLAQEWGRCWYLIEESITECLNKEMEQKYTKVGEKLKKTS